MHASHREDVEAIGAGDLGAIVGMRNVSTGDTLADEMHQSYLNRFLFQSLLFRFP